MQTQAPARRPTWGPRRERAFFLLALACIIGWGFSGPWELPPPEPAEGPVVTNIETDAPDLVSRGAKLFEDNGCYACHSVAGERKIGPSLNGIFGESVQLSDGGSAVVDDEYLIESILYPQASLVATFEDAAMPSYEGLIGEEDASALVEYIKSLD